MIGGIIGDIIGSRFEGSKAIFNDEGKIIGMMGCNHPDRDGVFREVEEGELFPESLSFTDDTVLMVATSRALATDMQFEREYVNYFEMFSSQNEFYSGPGIGYGCMFLDWAVNMNGAERTPYGSFGNGSAMRVLPVAMYANTGVEALHVAQQTAVCTHDYPKGIEGATTLAFTVFLARKGYSPKEILYMLNVVSGYNLNFSLEELIEKYRFVPTCEGSVPQAIYLALLGPDFETVMINCLKIGGDTDTIACMAGEIAYQLYGAPDEFIEKACRILKRDGELLYYNVMSFYKNFGGQILPDLDKEKELPKKKRWWQR